ncbi:hypothetical protein CRYUN_Cryun38cG0071000 [Craigia yunnanensis]
MFLGLEASIRSRCVPYGSLIFVRENAEIELNLTALVPVGIIDEEKRLNATYIISVARKLGCFIFLLPEDIMEHWKTENFHSQACKLFLTEEGEATLSPANGNGSNYTSDASPAPSISGEDECSLLCGEVSSLTIDDDDASDITVSSSQFENEDITVG